MSNGADLKPVERSYHAACYTTGLQLVVVGGEDNNYKSLSDSFVMSVAGAVMKQVMKMMDV